MRWPDAGLRARAAELRAEWRAEEEEWSRAALESFEHSRTLVDVLRTAMHRGDDVVLGSGGDAVRGVLAHVGDDWCMVHAPGGAIDVPVCATAPLVRVVERSRRGGTSGAPTAARAWRARLFEHEMGRDPCVLAVAGGERLVGRLRVGSDHVIVDETPRRTSDHRDVFVPLVAVLWVAPAGAGDLG